MPSPRESPVSSELLTKQQEWMHQHLLSYTEHINQWKENVGESSLSPFLSASLPKQEEQDNVPMKHPLSHSSLPSIKEDQHDDPLSDDIYKEKEPVVKESRLKL